MRRLDPLAVAIALGSLPLRLALAWATDLSPDEAYYLAAARHGLTIPDHPPATVWLLRLTELLPAGWPLEVRARAPWLLLGLLVSVLMVELVRSLSDDPQAQRWAAVLGSWLLLPLAGGFLATPDAPAFLAALVLIRAESCSRDRSALAWTLAAGFVGMLFKVIVAPVALVLALTSRRSLPRRAATVAACLLALPWCWPSLGFQLHHVFVPGPWTAGAAAAALAAALGGQLGLWTPLVPVVAWRFRAASLSPAFAAAAVLLGLFVASALLRATPPEPNWIAPAWIPVLAAASAALPAAPKLARAGVLATGPVLSVVLASHVLVPWLPLPAATDPSARLHGWSRGAPPVDAAGLGPYGPSAERCVYQGDCEEIILSLRDVKRKNLK
jgi:hypothetical protein